MITRPEGLGDVVASPDRPDRHAVRDALRHGDDVGLHPGVLESEPGTRATHACLDFVHDEQNAALVTDLPNPAEVVVVGIVHATFGLNRFEDHTADLGGQASFELVEIVPHHMAEPFRQRCNGSCFSGWPVAAGS